jgi:hypothetical protein
MRTKQHAGKCTRATQHRQRRSFWQHARGARAASACLRVLVSSLSIIPILLLVRPSSPRASSSRERSRANSAVRASNAATVASSSAERDCSSEVAAESSALRAASAAGKAVGWEAQGGRGVRAAAAAGTHFVLSSSCFTWCSSSAAYLARGGRGGGSRILHSTGGCTPAPPACPTLQSVLRLPQLELMGQGAPHDSRPRQNQASNSTCCIFLVWLPRTPLGALGRGRSLLTHFTGGGLNFAAGVTLGAQATGAPEFVLECNWVFERPAERQQPPFVPAPCVLSTRSCCGQGGHEARPHANKRACSPIPHQKPSRRIA